MVTQNGQNRWTGVLDRLKGFFTRYGTTSPQDDTPPPRTLAIVVCAIISVVLWLTLTMQETHTVQVPFETQIQNLPPDQALEDSLPSTIRAMVTGERIQLLRTVLDPPPVMIDVRLDMVDVQEAVALGNVRLLSVSPAVIQPKLGRRITRRLPVQLQSDIDLAEGHDFLQPPELTPDSVDVTGAERIVGRLAVWPTKSFRFSDLKDTLVMTVELSDTLGSLVTYQPQEVLVKAVAGEFIGGVRDIDVHVQGVPSGEVAVDPPTLRVRYTVLFSDYELAQHAPDFYAEVSYDEIRQDRSGRVTPRLHTPPDLEIRNVVPTPQTVRYYQRLEQ